MSEYDMNLYIFFLIKFSFLRLLMNLGTNIFLWFTVQYLLI